MVVRRINSYSAAFYILGGSGRSYVWGIKVVGWHRFARQPGCGCFAPGAVGAAAASPQVGCRGAVDSL